MAKDKAKAASAKGGTAAKKAKKQEVTYYASSAEQYPSVVKGNVSLDGDTLTVNWRRPRQSARTETILNRNNVLGYGIGDDDSGFVISTHPDFAGAPIVDATVTDVSSDGAFLTGTNDAGQEVAFNTALLNITTSAKLTD